MLVGLAQGDFSINSHDGERKIVNETERGMEERERQRERKKRGKSIRTIIRTGRCVNLQSEFLLC